MTVDIRIEGNGVGFYSIVGITAEGREFINERVYGGEHGVAYSDQTNLTQEIAEGATEDGLVVSVDGYVYQLGGARGELVDG